MKFLCLKKFPLNTKTLSWLSVLSIVPLIASFYFLYAKHQKIENLGEKVLFLQTKMEKKKQYYLQEARILSQIKNANPNYLQEHLSSMPFLIPEQQKWKMCLAQLGSSFETQKKYASLNTTDNKIEFLENSLQKTPLFEEREFSQINSIKLNEEDLKNLLGSIEGDSTSSYQAPEGAPQILMTSFSLKKSTLPEMQEKIYIIQMQLLTRQRSQ